MEDWLEALDEKENRRASVLALLLPVDADPPPPPGDPTIPSVTRTSVLAFGTVKLAPRLPPLGGTHAFERLEELPARGLDGDGENNVVPTLSPLFLEPFPLSKSEPNSLTSPPSAGVEAPFAPTDAVDELRDMLLAPVELDDPILLLKKPVTAPKTPPPRSVPLAVDGRRDWLLLERCARERRSRSGEVDKGVLV